MINFADPNMRNTITQALMAQRGGPPNLSATPTPSPGGMPPQMPGPVGGIPPALGGGAASSNLGAGAGMPPALGAGTPPTTMLGQPSPPSMPPPPALQNSPSPPAGPSAPGGGPGGGAFGLNTPQPGVGGSPTPMAPGNNGGLDPNILAQLTGVRS